VISSQLRRAISPPRRYPYSAPSTPGIAKTSQRSWTPGTPDAEWRPALRYARLLASGPPQRRRHPVRMLQTGVHGRDANGLGDRLVHASVQGVGYQLGFDR
jgi:hypothetical protein